MKSNKVIRVLAVTIVFWAIVFLGPFALMLWNAVSPAQYRPGELGYAIFLIAAQGIACGIAIYAARHICLKCGISKTPAFVNAIVACTLEGGLTVLDIVGRDGTENIVSGVLAFVVLLVGSIMVAKESEGEKPEV